MAYFVNKTDGNIAAVVEDGTINTETSLKLIGIGYPNYAETVAEDMVSLLENFSNPNPPANPIVGQTWFNNTINQLEVFDGDIFRPINNVNISTSEPALPKEGDFWYNDDLQQMFYRKGFEWQLISPSYSQYQGRTELSAEWLIDTSGFSHVALTFYNNGKRVIIFSTDDEYRIQIDGFSWINPGINLPNYLQTRNGIFWAGNGNSYYSGGLAVGGTDSQLQYNHLGNLAGASITTNGSDLTSTTGTFQARNLRANQVNSTVGGYIFPDGSTQITAAFNNSSAVNGSGSVSQVAFFSDSTHLTGSASLTTDGRNLTMSDGMLSVNNILLTPRLGDVLNGIAFADGSIQYTAARNNYNAVNGTGLSGQLAYFTDTTHVGGTGAITTNGTDIIMADGYLQAKQIGLSLEFGVGNNRPPTRGISFADGSTQYTAAVVTPQVQSDWNVTDNTQPSFIKNKPTITITSNNTTNIVSSIQISYPTSITQNSNFNWGVIRGVANETWYATTNLPAPYNRIPSAGVLSLDNDGATSYTNGNFGANTGDVEVTFNFSQSGKIIKRLSITAPVATLPIASPSILGGVKVGRGLSINSDTGVLSTNLPGYAEIGAYTMTGDLDYGRVGEARYEGSVYTKSPGDLTTLPGPIGSQWRNMGTVSINISIVPDGGGTYPSYLTMWMRIA